MPQYKSNVTWLHYLPQYQTNARQEKDISIKSMFCKNTHTHTHTHTHTQTRMLRGWGDDS